MERIVARKTKWVTCFCIITILHVHKIENAAATISTKTLFFFVVVSYALFFLMNVVLHIILSLHCKNSSEQIISSFSM